VQEITIIDTTAPEFSDLPQDITVECDSVPDTPEITASDNCSEATLTFEDEQADGSCMGEYLLTRTWTAVDECGNENIHIQIITVQDTTAPNLVSDLDEEITVTCDDIPEVPELVFEDACSEEITVDFEETSTFDGSTNDYEIIRDWTVTDDCGNQAVFSQIIFVNVESNVSGSEVELCSDEGLIDLFDYISGDFTLGGQWVVTQGDAVLNGSEWNLDPFEVELGTYIFTYIDSDTDCPSETQVIITVVDDCIVLACQDANNVTISKAVTPNGDPWNEYFEIKGIELCGFIVEVQIFNRWGAIIYENRNYENNWNGFVHSSSVGSADQVPNGTYYYIVNLKGSGLRPFSGPIYVGTR